MKAAGALGAIAALAGAGALVWYYFGRGKHGMTTDTLADYLRAKLPDARAKWCAELAAGLIDSCPDDFEDPQALGNADAAVRRWAIDVAAVAEHESGYGTDRGYQPPEDPSGWGDRGNAYGFFQLDRHYHWTFIQSDAAQLVQGQAKYAAHLLADNWRTFDSYAFADRERLAFVTYNASRSRVKKLLADGADVDAADATTTQRNGIGYGASVQAIVSEWS